MTKPCQCATRSRDPPGLSELFCGKKGLHVPVRCFVDRLKEMGGETASLMAAKDWLKSALGPPETWPQSLCSVVGLMLGSKFPMFVAWGEELGFLYNDAYAEILGAKHPEALGARFRDIWSEIWPDIAPLIEAALAGQATYSDDLPLVMNRRGYDEQTWFTFSYSPVHDESGRIAGMFCAVAETTDKVRAEQRQQFVVALGDTLSRLTDPAFLTAAAAELLGKHLGVGRAGYGEVDSSGQILSVARDWSDEATPSLAGEARVLDAFGPEVIAELRAGRTLVVEDCHNDPRTASPEYLQAWESIGTRALVVAPLIGAGRLIAVLYVHSGSVRIWSDLEVRLVEDVGSRTWAAVERARTETALRQSESKLHAIFANATVGLSEITPEGKFLRVNEEMCRLLGRSREELLQTDVASVTLPADREPSRQALTSALRSGHTATLDKSYVRTDGTSVPANSRVSRLVEPGGAPGSLLVVTVDLTERLAAEQRLRESEARFRLMADTVPQIVWITDADGRAEFFNKHWSQYTGSAYHPATAAAVASEHVHPDDEASTMEAFDAARRSGTTYLVEHRIRSASGAYRWFLVRGEPYREHEGGAIIRWFGASVDIHDRKLAEARLRELNETLEVQVEARSAERDQLWNLSQDMLARADFSGMMSAVSPAWKRVLGWNEHELLTRGYATFMHPDDMPPTLAAIELMGETGQPTRFENRISTSDGGWKSIEWTVAPEPDGGNFIAVGRDLSHAKAREVELQAAQEALRQSQKMEAMGSLTGGVAHDFNNLLTPIIGSLDMLVRKGVGSERERRLIDGALQSAERAKTLVQRLLAFARRQPLQSVPVDIPTLVEEMAGLFGSTVGPNIDVRVELAPDLPPALADANQLEMALLNLAVNARDAMPQGGELTLVALHENVPPKNAAGLQPGQYIRLRVGDTGTGMDEETLARAVEPFFSTKGIGKGTGLGLSMVHGLTAQLGGGLTIDSQIARGTTVTLWLPVSAAQIDGVEQPAVRGEKPVGRGTALLVDDEALVRMSTADMLHDFGFEVVEAGSAEEALTHLKAGLLPDLLVTDHLMPGMSGADLAREVKSLRPNLPVLIVSGYAEADGIAAGLPRLTKPFRNADLAACLTELLIPR